MNTHNINNQKGFTLVEVMVALLITGIMMTLVMQFIFSQMNAYQREQKVSDTQQNLRSVMDTMARDIRMAGAGIPKVPISTGQTGLTNNVIYPLYIIQGATQPANNTNGIFNIASTTATVNDSIIVIYKDPALSDANTSLAQDMTTSTAAIVVTDSTGFATNTPILITNAAGTKADLFMVTGVNGTTLQVGGAPAAYNNTATGHSTNFTLMSASPGYYVGDKVFAVKVARYDFSPDMANFPITKLVDNDQTRGTDNAVGEFFGNGINALGLATNTTNQAIRIEYLPYTGATAITPFARGMPTDPYTVGTVRITLTARTTAPTASSSMMRTRTLTTDIQLRNYNGN